VRPLGGARPLARDAVPVAGGGRGEEPGERLVAVVLVADVDQRQRPGHRGQGRRVGAVEGVVGDGEQQADRAGAGCQRRLADGHLGEGRK